MWTTQVFHVGRKEGLTDKQIVECVKIYSKEKGWQPHQIKKVLRYQGIESLQSRQPLFIICPRCDEFGKLNSFYATHQKVGTLHYYVAHEKWDRDEMGSWKRSGRAIGDKKYRRCYLYDILKRPEYLKKITNQLFPFDP